MLPMQTFHQKDRQNWMATLAKASLARIEAQVSQLGDLPAYEFLRPPEIGLAMVRGKAGGTGQKFNLGEITLTRCVVKLVLSTDEESLTGFGYVAGRSQRHAELAALGDALLQHPAWYERVSQVLIEPLQAEADQKQETEDRQTEATQVNFFTMLRGE